MPRPLFIGWSAELDRICAEYHERQIDRDHAINVLVLRLGLSLDEAAHQIDNTPLCEDGDA